MRYSKSQFARCGVEKNLGFLYICYIAKKRGFPPVYKVERVAKMSAKCAFFSVFQKIMVFCCAIFFGFADAFSANLPSGYTELEYIESSGTQYIDTGINATGNLDIQATVKILSMDSSISGLFGARNISNNSTLDAVWLGVSTSRTLWLYNNNTTNNHLPVWDTNKWYDVHTINGDLYLDASKIATYETATFSGPLIYLFSSNNGGSIQKGGGNFQFSSFKIKQNNTLVQDLIPAKRDSDGEIGMYDTVSNTFFTNAGTGTFTAGPEVLNPCRNLFDSSAFNTDVGQTNTWLHFQVPNGTYTMSTNFPPQTGQVYTNVWVLAGNVTSGIDSATNGVSLGHPKTITVTDGWYSVVYRSGIPNIPRNPKDYNWQLEQGSTATEYVPYNASCHNTNGIKIATTAYNSARFSPVMTDLNTTIATIRDIVTNTINQTAAIASLQADKQTRPEDACPAGKKCLLVETEENGVIVPHWFPIIEAPEE